MARLHVVSERLGRQGMGYTRHERMKAHAREEPHTATEIKTVGKSGQVSLGKSYAGKTLRLQRREDGSMLLTPVAVIPESQLWTLQEPHRSAIERGLAWAATNPPAESDLDELIAKHERRRSSSS